MIGSAGGDKVFRAEIDSGRWEGCEREGKNRSWALAVFIRAWLKASDLGGLCLPLRAELISFRVGWPQWRTGRPQDQERRFFFPPLFGRLKRAGIDACFRAFLLCAG
jgi:hypothetical protein